jgi:hypothetical protein
VLAVFGEPRRMNGRSLAVALRDARKSALLRVTAGRKLVERVGYVAFLRVATSAPNA